MNLSSPTSFRLTPIAASLALLATLTACGGGGDDGPSSNNGNNNVSQEQAQAAGVNSTVIPHDTSKAMAVALSTAQTVVAGGQANSTYTCPGGGTAVFTATGASLALLGNRQFDSGEQYTLTYTNCRGALGAASVNGSLSLTVNSASGSDFSVSSTTSNVVVALPLRTVRLNGNSSLTHTVVTNGSTTTTTDHWTTPNHTATVTTGAHTSTFSYSGVDLTRSVTTSNGAVTGSTFSGTTTYSSNTLLGPFTVTLATVGTATYDALGRPTDGTWTLTLPYNALTLDIDGAANRVTLMVDHGANGSIEHTFTWTVNQALNQAG